ncbi:response regulator transcription factor [Dactylosporangium sp. AC04546]|uniref:response regulator n=1 Tax=Dactylosporangium sp. AC04546 TaxID=2862460 RepID=UPI001EDCEE72|nr:response regulator transcription factor [Dactylosporangium sp. AC04546]WVK80961.1 response regulator transcription factor [Dactylosporangium sp. AC04546]
MIRVIVAEDQAVVRAGIAAILDAEPDITVVGQAADGEAAAAITASTAPDVAILDVRMPGTDGLAAADLIGRRHPATRIVMLTTFGLDEYVFAALRAGAAGFLLKDAEADKVVEAVRIVAAGEAILDPGVTRRLIDRFATGPGPDDAARLRGLTTRETQVLHQVARGLSNAEIAAVLGISPSTVKDHVAVILSKLGVRDRVQATIAAYEGGLIRPGIR